MFDSLPELIEKIYLGEDATIEFKRELPHRNSLADEIAAFANAKGGVILIGVDNGGEIIGVDRQELGDAEKTVVEICQDSIDPIVLIFTEKLRIDAKNLLKISEELSGKTPIYEVFDEELRLTIFASRSIWEPVE